MYDEKNSSTNATIQCRFNVALFLRYSGTLVIILGCIGNILSIVVFSRKALRSRSCSIYFLALSMSDINVLIGYTFENLLYHGYNIQVLSNSFMCKSIIFLIYASTDISNYLLTLAAMDRCILISNSTIRYRFCRKLTAKLMIICVIILFSLINSHFLFGFHIDNDGFCLPASKNYNFFYVNHYDSYIDIIKTVLIPFIIIFICNIFIIFKYTRRNTLISSTSIRRKNRRRREKDRQLTWFLLSTSLLFIFLSLPSEINDFVRTHLSQKFQTIYACQLWASTTLFILIHQINHASHFYVYTLTGPIFRKEFQKLICLFQKQTSKRNLFHSLKKQSLTIHYTQHNDIDDRRLSSPFQQTNLNSLERLSFQLDV
ncbi:unnamed protein product [Rotaria sordida]|uniref:G-protein coupled receptors family 1 profile domain-containing protein n=1 Tax=Rotaria sordida TaxID=392033 RepID=A0A819ILJ3_9BILA|nr:unnamed protein product [Rotaria sordida]CAF3919971.1 unnamed protein product [Rotaria sordida]CAF3968714.1 unnamed protein product [Rotaria sordida]